MNIVFNFKLIIKQKKELLTDEQVKQINKEGMVNVIFAYTGTSVLQIKIHHGY